MLWPLQTSNTRSVVAVLPPWMLRVAGQHESNKHSTAAIAQEKDVKTGLDRERALNTFKIFKVESRKPLLKQLKWVMCEDWHKAFPPCHRLLKHLTALWASAQCSLIYVFWVQTENWFHRRRAHFHHYWFIQNHLLIKGSSGSTRLHFLLLLHSVLITLVMSSHQRHSQTTSLMTSRSRAWSGPYNCESINACGDRDRSEGHPDTSMV